MSSQFWLWLTTAIMLIGGLAILAIGKRRTPTEELHTSLHGIVPIIAACSYFAMAIGQGAVVLPILDSSATRVFYYARYIDWSFTTPLLLTTLAITSMHAGPKRPGIIVGVLLADVMMIATSFFFGASEVPWIKWTWFVISCVAFLAVFYVIWMSQMEANRLERDDVRSNYRRNAMTLSVLWLIYPVILFFAPDGLGTFSDAFSVFCIAVLDVVSKVVYGLMTTLSDTKTVDRDLAETRTTTATTRMAA